MEENKEQQNDQSELGQKIQTLRTYSSDMADAVRENEISVIKVALAEKAKREKEEDFRVKSEGTGLQKVLLVIGSIIFIALGLIGSYFLFEKSQQQVASQPAVFDLAALVKAPLAVAGSPQSIHALFFTKTIGSTTNELSLPDFLTALNLSAPGALTRSLTAYMVGTYNSVDTTQKPHLFLMFQTQDYNQAYASMLQWEPTMLGDVAPLFGIDISGDNNSLLRKPFKDILINNNDARVLYDANGNALLYYIFIDKNDFIITDSQEAIREVTIRLQTKNTRSL